MSLSENHRWNILKDHFDTKGLVSHQIDTFDDYIINGIQRSVQEVDIKICQKDLNYRATFGDVYIPNPSIIEEDRKVREMFPSEARTRDLTYDSPIFVDIKEEIELEGQKPEIIIHRRVIIGRTPIMLRSEKCNLKYCSNDERIKIGECEWDQGGYFIIKGKERVLVGQLRGLYNQPIVMTQKPGEKYKFICDVRSMSEETGHSVLLQVKISTDDRAVVFSLPYIKEHINVGIVFKALGYLKDEEIEDIIGNTDGKLTKYIKYIIRDSYFIKTQDDALSYIGQYSMHIIKDEKRRDYASQIVENELLPHMGISSTIKEKIYFLGSMCNKLLLTNLGIRKEDDRDHYINKRVEMAGVLCCELFRTLFKKFTKSIEMQLEKKKQRPDILSIISRTTNITLGLKMSFCVPAGTMISLSNGLSMPVEQISNKSNNYEKVFGFNKEKNGLQISTHGGLACQGEKDTIKLTFEDGRTLICTPDHQILVLKEDKTTEWVEAIKIPINSRIVMGIDLPHDNLEEDLDNNWSFEIKYIYKDRLCKKIFKINTIEERSKTLAFARILGYMMTDASTPSDKGLCTVYFGSKIDVSQFLDDYEIVMNEKNLEVKNIETEDWGKTYSISLSGEFTTMFKNIKGIIKGKKVLQQRTLPVFLLEPLCPKSVIREFLGGLFGGDGHCPRLDIRKGHRTCIQGVAFSWTTEEKNLEVLKNVFENMQKLLEKVGIKDTYINGPYPQDEDDRYIYRVRISPSIDFHKYTGFRYCIHKTYKCNIASLYWRMEEEIKRQHSFIINTVNKLKENDKKMTIKKALEIAREELKEKEYILNNYYSLSNERDISKRREKGRSAELKYLQEKYGVPDAKDFIEKIGALYMFESEYATIRESDILPYFSLQLMDIRGNKREIVYDITNVFECHSYLANGLLLTNSTGNWGVQKNNYIRTGVSQVLARLSYGGTLSHLRRIVIPIGKEGKNSKIRQPHASQIMYLCPNECFEPETPILLWNGKIKLAKDIIVGDILIDENGKPSKVRKTISGVAPMYDVKINKPNFLNHTVTSNHILTLKIRNHKKLRGVKRFDIYWFDREKMRHETKSFKDYIKAQEFYNTIPDDDILDICIEDYLKLPKKERDQLVVFKCKEIQWPKQDVIIDPYILGMWLGDGHSTGSRFTTEDSELLFEWQKWAKDNNTIITLKPKIFTEKERKINKNYTYHSHQKSDPEKYRPDVSYGIDNAVLRSMLKKYNLLDNKHIPNEYLVNDRDTRLKVLAGLIDTDGNVRANGHEIRIQQGPDNFKIIDDTLLLAQSLGFCCHVNSGKSQWTHYFENGSSEKRYSTYKELTITGEFLYEIPTKLPRKKLNKFTLKNSLSKCDSYKQSKFIVEEKGIGNFVGWQVEGNGRFLLNDCTVVHNTPEGQSIGIVLNLALTSTVTRRIPTIIVKEIVEKCENFIFIDNYNEKNINPKVFINGVLVGITLSSQEFLKELQIYRKTGLLDKQISFSYNSLDNEIRIFSDEGRFIRPVFTLDDNGKLNINEKVPINWNKLVENDYIRYVDHSEIENSVIAMTQDDLTLYKNDFCEIEPTMMMGVMSNIIPYCDHTQSSRNIFQSSMGKQSIGIFSLSHQIRTDTITHVLSYPQKPLVSTLPSKFMGFDDMPYGINAIVAIACYTGLTLVKPLSC